MSWHIEQYNEFIAQARTDYDLTLGEARELYREVRDAFAEGPATVDDLDAYADYLQTAEGAAMVLESVLYDLDVVPEVFEREGYPDDYELDEGAELELTAETYSDET